MTDNDIVIRPFCPEDQAAARALILAGLGERWGYLDLTKNPDLDDIATTYAGATFLVACQNDGLVHDAIGRDGIVGTGVLIHEAPGVARIVRMSVATSMRRRGIGTLILSSLCESARAKGYGQIVLETTSTWDNAITFYRQHGFRIVSVHDGNTHFVLDLDPPSSQGIGLPN